MAVTADKYELPLYVADSGAELAKVLGVSRQKIYRMANGKKTRKKSNFNVVKVKVNFNKYDKNK